MREAPKIGPLPREKRATELDKLRRRHAAIRANCARQAQAASEMRKIAVQTRERLRDLTINW